jgi:hypothetical protein
MPLLWSHIASPAFMRLFFSPSADPTPRSAWLVALVSFALRAALTGTALAAGWPLLVGVLALRLEARRKQLELARQPRRIIIIRYKQAYAVTQDTLDFPRGFVVSFSLRPHVR